MRGFRTFAVANAALVSIALSVAACDDGPDQREPVHQGDPVEEAGEEKPNPELKPVE